MYFELSLLYTYTHTHRKQIGISNFRQNRVIQIIIKHILIKIFKIEYLYFRYFSIWNFRNWTCLNNIIVNIRGNQ